MFCVVTFTGNDSCNWLLSDGRFPGYGVWQPYGCMVHKYNLEWVYYHDKYAKSYPMSEQLDINLVEKMQ
jgi:hypothetical protein